jgi:Xaa-Pro aminopeptidase
MRHFRFKPPIEILFLVRVSLLLAAFVSLAPAQSAFDKAEFAARRAKVYQKIGDSVAMVLANPKHIYPIKFRQSPDFYYLTGIEEPDALLVLDGRSKRSTIFAIKKAGFRIATEGPGLLDLPDAPAVYGIDRIVPFDETFWLNFGSSGAGGKIYLPMTPPDDLEYSRGEMRFEDADKTAHTVLPENSRYSQLIAKVRQMQPQLKLADINPILDQLRWVKTPYEIERMRVSGKVGAEGVKEAIRGTKPGMYEYELEAAARFVFTRRGARGDAFTPIVASGPNTVILHYTDNNRRMNAGDVVYMDYGSDYDYYVSDITRTWPVSGKFTPEQEKMYRCIFEARAAIIAAIKPGAKVSNLQDVAAVVYKKYGFEKEFEAFGRYVGHFVGLSVHDVGDEDWAFVPGVVFNVEPLIQNDQQKIHLRLEDTVLVTAAGSENLTAAVPAELNAVYALIRQPAIGAAVR